MLTEFLYTNGQSNSDYLVSKYQFAAFESCLQDHSNLLFNSTLIQDLSLALQRFHKLRVLGMRRGLQHRPLGVAMLENAVGLDPCVVGAWLNQREIDRFLYDPNCLFAHLLLAMSEQTPRLERLYTDGVQVDRLAMAKLLSAPARSILCRLRVLELNTFEPRMVTTDRNKYGEIYDAHSIPGLPESCAPFERSVVVIPIANELCGLSEGTISVLKAAPQIEDLTLTMWPNKRFSLQKGRPVAYDENGNRIILDYHWAAFGQVVQAVSLTNLTRLSLGSIKTTAGLLDIFLSSSAPTLRDLRLAYVELFQVLRDDYSGAEPLLVPWRLVFSTLARDFQSLSYVHFRWLHVYSPCCWVTFDTDPANDDERGWDDNQSDENLFSTQRKSEPLSPSYLLEVQGLTEVQHQLRVNTKKHWYSKPERHEIEQDERDPL